MSNSNLLLNSVRCFGTGIYHALQMQNSVLYFITSKKIRSLVIQCLLLNGFLFLGSVILLNYIILPILRLFLTINLFDGSASVPESQEIFSDLVAKIVSWSYHLLWLYPIYSISFILNAIWYQDIADQAFAVGGQKQPKTTVDWPRFVNSLAGELYRVLLTLSFLLQHFLVSFIPYVGKYLSFIHMCWLYSLYSFEYKWALLNWSMEKRVEFFEDRGFYFVGFGMPFALLTVAFPAFINGGVFALAFPLFIILAMEAPVERCPPSLSVPIFSMPSRINVFFLRFLGNRCKWCKSKQQLSPFTNSAGEDDEKKLQ